MVEDHNQATPFPDIRDGERLSRFIFETSKFSSQNSIVKFRAFLPGHTDPELSVSRTEGLDEPGCWTYGDLEVGAPRNAIPIARADFIRSEVPDPLSVRPDEPPPRHALIEGWGDDKEARKNLAQLLAAASALVIRLAAP